MATNLYTRPAEANFINTYVPIPFEQLYTVANAYKTEYDRQVQALREDREKYGYFTSRSEKDMETWDREVNKPIQNIVNRIADDPDLLKTAEGRSLINSAINNRNYGLLSELRQNAQMLDEAWRTYDTRWQDNTYDTITNWDTSTQGLYNRPQIAYRSWEEIANPYFEDLEYTLDEAKSGGQWEYYSIKPQDLRDVANNHINELYQLPEVQKHLQQARRQGIIPDGMSDKEYAYNMIVQSQRDRLKEKRVANSNYWDALNYKLKQRAFAKQYGDDDEAPKQPVMTSDAVAAYLSDDVAANLYKNPNLFDKTNKALAKYSVKTRYWNGEMTPIERNQYLYQDAILRANEAAQNGNKELANTYMQHAKTYSDRLKNYNREIQDSYKADLRSIMINGGTIEDNKINTKNLYSSSNKLINDISVPISDMNYIKRVMEDQASNIVMLDDNGVPTQGFSYKTAKQFTPVTRFGLDVLGKETTRLKSSDKDFDRVFKNLNNVIVVPSGLGFEDIGTNNDKNQYQKVKVFVNKKEMDDAGFDEDWFEDTFGITPIKNVSSKFYSKSQVKGQYGAETSWGSITDESKMPPLTGDYYVIEATAPIPRENSTVSRQNAADIKDKFGTTVGGKSLEWQDTRSFGFGLDF